MPVTFRRRLRQTCLAEMSRNYTMEKEMCYWSVVEYAEGGSLYWNVKFTDEIWQHIYVDI
jgi:hypothetical protein